MNSYTEAADSEIQTLAQGLKSLSELQSLNLRLL